MTGLLSRIANRSLDFLFFPVMDRYWRRRARGRLACLLYHRVAESGLFPFIEQAGASAITREDLFNQLKFLQDQGARFMTFADLRRGEFPSADEFGVIVSFDDGFRDNYEEALEVLDALGIPGVIFQSSALVDSRKLIWEHALYWIAADTAMTALLEERAHLLLPKSKGLSGSELTNFLRQSVPVADVEKILAEVEEKFNTQKAQAELTAKLYPSAEHLLRAQKRGHEIASHGHRHYVRANIDEDVFEEELRSSSSELGKIIGEPPAAFSYPFNSYLPGDKEICGRYFQQVATVDSKPISISCDPLEIPRFSWPGPARNPLRARRWLWTGRI